MLPLSHFLRERSPLLRARTLRIFFSAGCRVVAALESVRLQLCVVFTVSSSICLSLISIFPLPEGTDFRLLILIGMAMRNERKNNPSHVEFDFFVLSSHLSSDASNVSVVLPLFQSIYVTKSCSQKCQHYLRFQSLEIRMHTYSAICKPIWYGVMCAVCYVCVCSKTRRKINERLSRE